jgi:hypothetical protein
MTDIDSSLTAARLRARDYADIDGLFTLVGAALNLTFGFILWMNREDSGWEWVEFAAFLALSWFFAGSESPVMTWLKSRVTYPRTGYVALPQPVDEETCHTREPNEPVTTWRSLGMFGWWVMLGHPWMSSILLTAGFAVDWFGNLRNPRFSKLEAAFLWLVFIIAAFLPIQEHQCLSILFAATGIGSLLLGTMKLARYLRRHPETPA